MAEFFVSPAGDDGADGSRQAPFRSVGAAIARATSALGNGRQRIAVCAGDYRERATPVRGAIEIQGSYDCTSWTRRPFDDTQLGPSYELSTRITNAEPVYALFGTSDDPTGVPTLSGLSLEVTRAVMAISIEGATRLSHVSIQNTSTPLKDGKYTISGVFVSGTGSRIENCRIFAAPTPAPGVAATDQAAFAVAITSGAHVVRNNSLKIQGGRGTSVALSVSNSTGLELENNHLELLSNIHDGKDVLTSAGVISTASVVSSTRNTIVIESPGNLADDTRIQGMVVASGAVESEGDRVLGPRAIEDLSPKKVIRFIGFHGDEGLRRVVNASFYWRLAPRVSMGESAAIRVAPTSGRTLRPTDLTVAHNTVYISGTREKASTSVRAFALSNEALEISMPHAVTYTSNLVLFDVDQGFLVRGACSRTDYARIASNRYGGGVETVDTNSPEGCTPPASLESVTVGGASVDNAVVDCGGACSDLLLVDPQLVALRGLQPSAAACALPGLSVSTDPAVLTDGSGAARGQDRTLPGAIAGCP